MLAYLFIRLVTYPLGYVPYPAIHALGKVLGTLAYYLLPKFRKRALSNLALASALDLTNEEIILTAKYSMQTLMQVLLEYPKLAQEKDIHKIAVCDNPEEANSIMQKGTGVIFFCGHQANWELLFLEGTSRMKGVAIGRPIKNIHLYNWILSIRQKFGGIIIEPKKAAAQGLRALKSGAFLGIVGDQGMPDSGFSSPFLGRLAYTSPMPAMLAYKTDTPIIVATTEYRQGKYHIRYSPAIYPDKNTPKETEIPRLMHTVLALYEDSIKKRPHEWLWVHNRWKQQSLDRIKKPYRHDSIALILSDDESLLKDLSHLRAIYPTEELTIFVPKSLQSKITLNAQVRPYSTRDELFEKTYKYKLLYSFIKDLNIDKHYKKYATQTIVHPTSIQDIETLVRNA